jgi:maltose alpha-D-glucosyltransferase/alpha-amylase
MLALASEDATPVRDALEATPDLPEGGQWATFLRNHDEVDLSRLSDEQRQLVFSRFGPDETMQLYGRGIRRRLAPMLGNDRKLIELAYALQFSLHGTPVLRYGEELGMGDDLSLNGRDAIRTPMQWTDGPGAGFSTAKKLVRPVITEGEYGSASVNVITQQQDPGSLLSWFERMIRVLRECPEIGLGTSGLPDLKVPKAVLLHRAGDVSPAPGHPEGTLLFLHNLGADDVTVDLSSVAGKADAPYAVFADRDYPPIGDLSALDLAGYGYRWIRTGSPWLGRPDYV